MQNRLYLSWCWSLRLSFFLRVKSVLKVPFIPTHFHYAFLELVDLGILVSNWAVNEWRFLERNPLYYSIFGNTFLYNFKLWLLLVLVLVGRKRLNSLLESHEIISCVFSLWALNDHAKVNYSARDDWRLVYIFLFFRRQWMETLIPSRAKSFSQGFLTKFICEINLWFVNFRSLYGVYRFWVFSFGKLILKS